jgi:hypothetical protein
MLPLSSGLLWQPTRTPSVLPPPAPPRRRGGLPSPSVDAAAPPRPESARNPRSMLSNDVQTFCRGSHAGCKKRRGARSSTCVCVGATIGTQVGVDEQHVSPRLDARTHLAQLPSHRLRRMRSRACVRAGAPLRAEPVALQHVYVRASGRGEAVRRCCSATSWEKARVGAVV